MFLGPFGRLQPEEDEKGYWHVDCAGQKVEDLVKTTEVKNSKMNYSVLVNDVQTERDYIMQDDDDISILPLFFAG